MKRWFVFLMLMMSACSDDVVNVERNAEDVSLSSEEKKSFNIESSSSSEKIVVENSSDSLSSETISSIELSSSSSFVFSKVKTTTKTIGYMMNWRSSLADNTISSLSHLILTGLTLDTDKLNGSLDTTNGNMLRHIPILKKQADSYGTKLMVMVGGWGQSKGFSEAAASAEHRERFASELTSFCINHGLAGADIDWEFPEKGEFQNYELMIEILRKKFDERSLVLTAAIAQDQGSKFTAKTWDYLHWIHIMAYDMNWANKGQKVRGNHAPVDLAETLLPKWEAYGIDKKKLVLGMPFYGRNKMNWGEASAYADIYNFYEPDVEDSEIDEYYYNGPETIYNKTKYVVQNGFAGVMIWEIAHDLNRSHEYSLLRFSNQAVLDFSPSQK